LCIAWQGGMPLFGHAFSKEASRVLLATAGYESCTAGTVANSIGKEKSSYGTPFWKAFLVIRYDTAV